MGHTGAARPVPLGTKIRTHPSQATALEVCPSLPWKHLACVVQLDNSLERTFYLMAMPRLCSCLGIDLLPTFFPN